MKKYSDIISGAVLSGKVTKRSPLIDCNLPLSFFSVPGRRPAQARVF